MSAEAVASLNFATQQVGIYLNLFDLVIGIPGGIFNIIVFLSLKTFRDSTCAFYLIIMSFFNIGQLVTGSLSRFVFYEFSVDWTTASIFYCKLRAYLFQICALTSLTCLCLATIDQYFATCSRPRWQRWSNIKLVRYISAIVIIFWSIFAIPYPIYYDITVSSSTGQMTCTNTNTIFSQYNADFHRIVMLGFLPNFITALFGFLAHRNVTQLAYRIVPLVRRELDKQLTKMLLVQVVFNIFALLLFNIVSVIVPYIVTSEDPVVLAKLQFVQTLSYAIYYLSAAVSINY